MNIKKQIKGFTLVELLVVIGIISILFAVVLVAINPAKRFAEANNSRRTTDVNSILDGILQYTVDSKGTLPTGLNIVSTTGSEDYRGMAVRLIGTATTAQTPLACVGIKTCAMPGFGSCTGDPDCTNACVGGKCTITGRTCTGAGNGDANECGAAVLTGACTAGACTNAGMAGVACPGGNADCDILCTSSKCDKGPLKGYYCDAASDCGSAAASTCSTTETLTADIPVNLSALAPTYFATVPKDPDGADTNTLYAVENVKGKGRIHVMACAPDPIDGVTTKIDVIR